MLSMIVRVLKVVIRIAIICVECSNSRVRFA